MDDQPMWDGDCVVALTPNSAITLPATVNEFAIKDTKNEAVSLIAYWRYKNLVRRTFRRNNRKLERFRTPFISRFFPPALFDQLLREIRAFSQHEGETLTDAWLRMKEVLINCHGHNLSKGGIIKIIYHCLSETTQEVLNATAGGPSKTDTKRIMARMDAITMKMDAQEEEAKFMQTFRKTRFYNDYRDRNFNRDNWHSSEWNDYNRDNYRSNTNDKPYDLQKQFNDFMKAQQSTNAFVKETFMDLKAQLETVAKNHQASIQNLKTKFDRLAKNQSGRPSGSLPSNTQPNPRGNHSKAYQPPQSCNEYVNAVFTQSGKTYDSPINLNEQQEDAKNFDSDDENEEPTPKPKPQPTKETQTTKPYKLKIPYPQRLRKEKMEAQYGKFLDIICVVQINVPLIDVLARMPNYGKFLKDLISNKNKIEQIYAAFLSDESSAMIQNKLPPKLGDPGSFLIPCNFNKAFSCNALADLVIRVKQKQFTLGVGTERMIFNIDSDIKHSYSNDDTCFSIDVVDEILEKDFDALLDEGSQILHSIKGTILEEKVFAEFDEFIAMATDENTRNETEEEPEFEKITINTDYKIKTSLEEPPMDLELKPLPDNFEYVFLEEPSLLL
ncbi:hypothetical protein Tco_0475050 [Tanacetum coccineum]